MTSFRTDFGTVHFVGIGGIGMSGIAEVMHNLGFTVQGSDAAEGYVVEGLRKRGIPVAIGQRAENIGDAECLERLHHLGVDLQPVSISGLSCRLG